MKVTSINIQNPHCISIFGGNVKKWHEKYFLEPTGIALFPIIVLGSGLRKKAQNPSGIHDK